MMLSYSSGLSAGEFAEARFEHVALLELLDVLRADFLVGEERRRCRPPPSLARDHQPSRLEARLKVRPTSRSIRCTGRSRCARFQHRALEFGAGFDAELFGQAALVGGEGQVGGEQRGLAGADHLDQVEPRQRVRIGQGLQALRVEFDRDRVEGAAADRIAHRFHAGLRDVRGAQQGVAHAVALDDRVRLLVQHGLQGLSFMAGRPERSREGWSGLDACVVVFVWPAARRRPWAPSEWARA